MKKQNEKDELQSRREFFRNAAKAALPVLGAIVLANAPLLAKASEVSTGCEATCTYSCKNTCDSCQKSCGVGCGTTCSGKCIGSCNAICQNSAHNS